MKSQIQRSRKYAAKLSGDVLHRRVTADGDRQKRAFGVVSGDQVGVERLTKRILEENGVMVGLNHYYMNFAKKIYQDKGMYSGGTLITEVCAERDHWELRGLAGAVLDSIIARMGLPVCAPPEPPCDWDWKRKLTFSGNVSATDLDDFPVLVHLTVANFDFNKAQNLGQDIRFMDSDTCPTDGVPLKHEIELWDKPNSQAWVWVKVPRIDGGSVNDFIYMFYGNALAPDGQDADNTWVATYVGVWHHHSDPVLLETSGSGHNGAKNGNPTMTPAGQIDNAITYDGVGDFYDCGNPADFDLGAAIDFTIGGWLNYTTVVPAGGGPIGKIHLGTNDGWYVYIFPATGGLSFGFRPPGGPNVNLDSIGFDGRDGFWHYWVVTGDRDGFAKIYVDGIFNNQVDISAVGNINQAVNVLIGRAKGAERYKGDQDEMRFERTVIRTADWIQAQFRSMKETLITYGAEE